MEVQVMVREALRKLRHALKPHSARTVEELAREIRLDNARIMAATPPEDPSPEAAPDSNGKNKRKKEDPTGSFRAFPF